jgi:signal peptidase I
MDDLPVQTPQVSATSASPEPPVPAADDRPPDVRLDDLVQFVRLGIAFDPIRADTANGSRKGLVREWVESLAFTIIFVLVFTSYIAQATQVPTESMKPTILVGDHFFLDKIVFPANFPSLLRSYLPQRSVHRGDIIAFRSPTDGNIPFVKRVIGEPGDTIEVKNKNVYVNHQKSDEPYKIHVDQTVYGEDPWTPEELKVRDNYGPVVVPPDKFFVMGDNRDNSNDSRYWGFVDRLDIIGKPLFVYWSYESDPYVPGDKSIQEIIESYASVAIHFFSRTRWFRIGTMIE